MDVHINNKSGISNTLATALLTKLFEGPGTFPAGLYDMQFGFMPGCSTTVAIFIVHQLQENCHAVNKTLYMTFADLEEAFNRVTGGPLSSGQEP